MIFSRVQSAPVGQRRFIFNAERLDQKPWPVRRHAERSISTSSEGHRIKASPKSSVDSISLSRSKAESYSSEDTNDVGSLSRDEESRLSSTVRPSETAPSDSYPARVTTVARLRMRMRLHRPVSRMMTEATVVQPSTRLNSATEAPSTEETTIVLEARTEQRPPPPPAAMPLLTRETDSVPRMRSAPLVSPTTQNFSPVDVEQSAFLSAFEKGAETETNAPTWSSQPSSEHVSTTVARVIAKWTTPYESNETGGAPTNETTTGKPCDPLHLANVIFSGPLDKEAVYDLC